MRGCDKLGLEFGTNLLDREQPAIGVLDGEHDGGAGSLPSGVSPIHFRHHFGYGTCQDRISHDLPVLDLPRDTKRITHMARREVRLAFLGDSRQDTFAVFRSYFASDAFF
jgi:hypothetical protein